MAAERWSAIPLDQLVDQSRGISYGIVQPGPSVRDGVPVVRVSDIRNGRISTDEPLKVARDIESAHSRTRLRGGELLLTLVGTVGETAIVPESLAGWNTARAVAVIPVEEEIGAYWVQLVLKGSALRHVIESRLNTTVQATLNLRDVAQLPIVLPPATVREHIVDVLGTIERKIDLNQRMNETLKSISRALFNSTYSTVGTVHASGWRRVCFSAIAGINRDSITPAHYPDETFDHYSIPAYDEGGLPVSEKGVKIRSNKFIVEPDCVLVSKLNPRIPRIWMPHIDTSRRAICSTEFLVLRPTELSSREFLFGLCGSQDFQDRFAAMVTGTSGSHQRVKPEYVTQMEVAVPPSGLVREYTERVAPVHARSEHNLRENQTLARLLDTMLPQLMSGSLRLNAED